MLVTFRLSKVGTDEVEPFSVVFVQFRLNAYAFLSPVPHNFVPGTCVCAFCNWLCVSETHATQMASIRRFIDL